MANNLSSQIETELWELIDSRTGPLTKKEYVDLMYSISSDAETRAEASEQELEDEAEDE